MTFLRHPKEKDLKGISLDEFEIQLMELIRKDVQPKRSKREDITEEHSEKFGCHPVYDWGKFWR
jgi:hypothetical protein